MDKEAKEFAKATSRKQKVHQDHHQRSLLGKLSLKWKSSLKEDYSLLLCRELLLSSQAFIRLP
jgi:hypothetical protein